MAVTSRQNIPRWSRPYANVRDSGGPTRVRDEEPPEGWEPMPFIGFTNNHTNDEEGERDEAATA